MENHTFVTHVFPAEEVVKLSMQTADLLQSPNWKDSILSGAACEGAIFCGITENRMDHIFEVLIPKADIRTWERVAAANGTDVTVIHAPTQCAVALSRLQTQ